MPTPLPRSDLHHLPEYSAVPPIDPARIVKLDANENPFGPSPRALRALAEMQHWHYYATQEKLRAALAEYVGARMENIVVTNGADESIDLVLRAVLEPGQAVIDCPPSFEMYRIFAHSHRAALVEVPRRDDFSLDTDAVTRAGREHSAQVILLTSPNNPDGGLLPRADLLRLLELPALVVVDEAYAEFAGETAIDLLPHHDNLAVLRTLSKWAGLAGLRVGYSVLSAPLAGAVLRLKAPYNVNVAGLVAAAASLEDRDYLMANVRKLNAERERLAAAFCEMGRLTPLPSHGNFLLCRTHGIAPSDLQGQLFARGILIRAYTSPRLSQYVRISVGTPGQNDALLAALKSIGRDLDASQGRATSQKEEPP